MTVIATALKHMLAAGMPADAIVAAVAEMEAHLAVATAAEPQPSKGALRTRRYREKLERERHEASHSVTSDAHVTVVTEIVTQAPAPNKAPQTPKINPTPHTHGGRARATAAAWPCPDGVDPQHWTDFLANRRMKRMACTGTAYEGQLRKIAELTDADWPPGRIVQHAAEHGWGGIHDPRKTQDHHNGHRSRPAFHDRPSAWAPRPGMAGLEPASLDD